MINKVYKVSDKDEADLIVDEKRFELNDTQENVLGEVPGTSAVLCDAKYRRATWLCVIMAVFNQLDGINVMNFYSNTIFENIFDKDAKEAATYGSIMVGIAEIIGVLLAPAIGS